MVLWDLAEGTPRAMFAKGMVDNFARNAACSADGSGLVVSREDGSIREIDIATAEERVLLPGDGGRCLDSRLSPLTAKRSSAAVGADRSGSGVPPVSKRLWSRAPARN